jgi:hypothetical protein
MIPRTQDHRNIQKQNLRGKNSAGIPWSLSEDDANRAIEGRKEEFYASVDRRTVDVVAATHNGRKYLKTTTDGYSPDNLLNLDECP